VRGRSGSAINFQRRNEYCLLEVEQIRMAQIPCLIAMASLIPRATSSSRSKWISRQRCSGGAVSDVMTA